MPELLKAALYYTSMLGWKIFPCVPREKRPLTAHGVKDATDLPNTIRAWWEKWPDANIGLACGPSSGVYVVDVDVNDKVDGYASLKKLGPLPKTIVQDTPSGGAHALFKTDNPPPNKNGLLPGIDIRGDGYYIIVAPSIHPNGGEYEWLEGASPWNIELAEYPDFMRPTVVTLSGHPLPQLTQPQTAFEKYVTGASAPPSPVDDDTLKRASRYLATMAPAVQGQAGHDSLFAAATAMVWGFGLSDPQASHLLLGEYNPRCDPPWDMGVTADNKDFLRKISQVREKPPKKPYGYLVDDASQVDMNADTSMIDVDSLIAEATPAPAPVAPPPPAGDISRVVKAKAPDPEIAYLSRPGGILGELCDWINGTAMCHQPMLTLACSLTFMGTLFGRKVRDELNSRTNLYCMGIGDSSAGKQHAVDKINDLCHATGTMDLLGGTDIASDTAIEELVSKRPAVLCMCDEIGFLLSSIGSGQNPHLSRVVSMLMRLYSSAKSIYKGKEYADSDNVRTIIQPCLSLYGTSSPIRFNEGISLDQIHDGWLGRCLMFQAAPNVGKERDIKVNAPPPDSLIEMIQKWYARRPGVEGDTDLGDFMVYHGKTGATQQAVPKQIEVPRSKEAEKIFVELDKMGMAIAKKDPVIGCLWKKAEEQARRIALIVACGEEYENPAITASHAEYACRLMKYVISGFDKYVLPEIAVNQLQVKKKRICLFVEAGGPGGVRHRDVVKKTRFCNMRERKDMIDDLIEAGDIVIKPVGKTLYYFTPKNFAEYKKVEVEK